MTITTLMGFTRRNVWLLFIQKVQIGNTLERKMYLKCFPFQNLCWSRGLVRRSAYTEIKSIDYYFFSHSRSFGIPVSNHLIFPSCAFFHQTIFYNYYYHPAMHRYIQIKARLRLVVVCNYTNRSRGVQCRLRNILEQRAQLLLWERGRC